MIADLIWYNQQFGPITTETFMESGIGWESANRQFCRTRRRLDQIGISVREVAIDGTFRQRGYFVCARIEDLDRILGIGPMKKRRSREKEKQ